jgi:hypothetical protein
MSEANHVELKSMLKELTQLATTIRLLDKEMNKHPIVLQLKDLKKKQKELKEKCKYYMTHNNLETVRTTSHVTPLVQEGQGVKEQPMRTFATCAHKPPRSYSVAELEQLLPGYFQSRGLKNDTEVLLNYLEETVEPKPKIYVRCRTIANVNSKADLE